MKKTYRKRNEIELVKYTRELSRPHYNALQRYSAISSKAGGPLLEAALERLPGFKKLLQEEMEAYATDEKIKQQRIKESRSDTEKAIISLFD